jgi:hypothetical protein
MDADGFAGGARDRAGLEDDEAALWRPHRES